ncbi:hypothetical protein ONZ45_g3532 [Pleurotus djamor]|nr:hypothetical protein ONZ45_g3532 [Pleurotus djamor]
MGDGLSRLYDEETHVVLTHYTVPQLSRSLLIHETLYRPQSRAMGMDHVDFSCHPVLLIVIHPLGWGGK